MLNSLSNLVVNIEYQISNLYSKLMQLLWTIEIPGNNCNSHNIYTNALFKGDKSSMNTSIKSAN